MVRKEIVGGAIAAAAVIILVSLVIPSEDLIESEVVVKETKIAVKPTDIAEFSAVQYGDELSLSMSLGDIIPESLDDIPLSEDSIGFGYGWFGVFRASDSIHVESTGPGHMLSYLVNMYRNDTISNDWKLEGATVDVLFQGDYYIDYCIRTFDVDGNMVLANKTVSIKTPPDSSPVIRAYFVLKAASFELVPENKFCHDDQIGVKLIDFIDLE